MISVRFQGTPFNIMVIQVYALTSNAEEAEVEQFYEDLEDFLELRPKKGRGTRDQLPVLDHQKSKEVPQKHLFLLY